MPNHDQLVQTTVDEVFDAMEQEQAAEQSATAEPAVEAPTPVAAETAEPAVEADPAVEPAETPAEIDPEAKPVEGETEPAATVEAEPTSESEPVEEQPAIVEGDGEKTVPLTALQKERHAKASWKEAALAAQAQLEQLQGGVEIPASAEPDEVIATAVETPAGTVQVETPAGTELTARQQRITAIETALESGGFVSDGERLLAETTLDALKDAERLESQFSGIEQATNQRDEQARQQALKVQQSQQAQAMVQTATIFENALAESTTRIGIELSDEDTQKVWNTVAALGQTEPDLKITDGVARVIPILFSDKVAEAATKTAAARAKEAADAKIAAQKAAIGEPHVTGGTPSGASRAVDGTDIDAVVAHALNEAMPNDILT